MTLLDFARGPALHWSLIIMLLGLAWRLFGIMFIGREKNFSAPRQGGTGLGVRAIFRRFWPHKEFIRPTMFHMVAGYILHIGLFITILLFAPHVLFLADLLGLPQWPHLPSNLVMLAGTLTAASLVAFVVRRMIHPVMRRISSLDDYLSSIITLLPVVTGMMAYAHIGLPYPTMLAVHILSVELLFIWIPVSKLAHVILFIPSRYYLGANMGRRGVKV